MNESPRYEVGVPSWVDLGSPDPDASARFYGALFGWQHEKAEPVEESGGYGFFKVNDKMIAGVGPLMGEGQPVAWNTYIYTDDADATAAKVKEAGGQVLMEPFDVMQAGRMGVFMDPTGAAISVWQPHQHTGAELVNAPGALSWDELNTRDPDAAKAFYRSVFGWEAEDTEDEGLPYTQWRLPGRESPVGGMLDMRGRVPDEVPPHWIAYFAVDDCDGVVERAKEQGGGVNFGPMDISVGRFAVLSDPQGAVFAIIQPSEQGSS